MKEQINKGLAMDIDETISNTVYYYFDQMMTNIGNPENLTIQEMLKKYTYTYNVPYWRDDAALGHLEKLRHDNDLYLELPIIVDSNHYVQKIDQKIPISCYLTIRPNSAEKTTKEWLKKNNFPDRPVITRPAELEYNKGQEWKAKYLAEKYPTIVGIIDDNPSIVDLLPSDYKGIIFLYNHLEYNHNTNLKIIPCQTWPDVYKKISEIHQN